MRITSSSLRASPRASRRPSSRRGLLRLLRRAAFFAGAAAFFAAGFSAAVARSAFSGFSAFSRLPRAARGGASRGAAAFSGTFGLRRTRGLLARGFAAAASLLLGRLRVVRLRLRRSAASSAGVALAVLGAASASSAAPRHGSLVSSALDDARRDAARERLAEIEVAEPEVGEAEIVDASSSSATRAAPLRPGGEEHRLRRRLQVELHAGRRHERVVDVVLGERRRDAERDRDLVDEQVARVVVLLALLRRQRADARERVEPLHHLGDAEHAARDEPVGVVAVAHLPVELGVVELRGEVVEHALDLLARRDAAEPDGRDLVLRDEDRGAVLLALHPHEHELLPGDVLLLDADDRADALVRIDDAVAGPTARRRRR